MRGRTVAAAVAAWMVAVGGAAWLSWTAINSAGQQVAAPLVPAAEQPTISTVTAEPSASQPPTPSASAAPDQSRPAPSGTAHPTPGPFRSPPAAGPAEHGQSSPVPANPADLAGSRTVSTRGGDAAFRCASGSAGVVYATPANGWRAEVEQEGGEARVDFRSAKDRVRIRVQCDHRTPDVSVEDAGSH